MPANILRKLERPEIAKFLAPATLECQELGVRLLTEWSCNGGGTRHVAPLRPLRYRNLSHCDPSSATTSRFRMPQGRAHDRTPTFSKTSEVGSDRGHTRRLGERAWRRRATGDANWRTPPSICRLAAALAASPPSTPNGPWRQLISRSRSVKARSARIRSPSFLPSEAGGPLERRRQNVCPQCEQGRRGASESSTSARSRCLLMLSFCGAHRAPLPVDAGHKPGLADVGAARDWVTPAPGTRPPSFGSIRTAGRCARAAATSAAAAPGRSALWRSRA